MPATAVLSPDQLKSNDLGWETTAQLDIGLDFGFFNNRLTGEIDYYNKQTTDLSFMCHFLQPRV